jgi:hypothetical protein
MNRLLWGASCALLLADLIDSAQAPHAAVAPVPPLVSGMEIQ